MEDIEANGLPEKGKGMMAQEAPEENEMPDEDEGEEEGGQNFSGRPGDMAKNLAGGIPEKFQEAFSRVVKAGMKMMFSEKTHKYMIEQLNQEGSLSENIGNAVAGLMVMMFEQSNRTMPGEVIIPAGTYLMFMGADYLEKVTGEEITPDVTAEAVQVMVEKISSAFGIDPSKLYAASEKAASGGYQ